VVQFPPVVVSHTQYTTTKWKKSLVTYELVSNIAYPEINDPKGMCRDVTGLGRWGNGDVEVGLSTLDDLPYIMGLVRQAFEKQMGNGSNA
jgi:predicted transport protein